MTHINIAGLEVGQEIGSTKFLLTRDSLVRYAGASGDFNQIHFRDDVAASVGLPGVLAHGMLTMGAAVQVAVNWAGNSGAVIDYQVRFTKPVVVDAISGAELLVTGAVGEIDAESKVVRIDLEAVFNDTKVLGKAQARVQLW
jgi:acyl dehydratase